jgi:CheY-like chemotaxis protein
VAFANDGCEAVHLYRVALQSDQRFDLVIMDLTVPGGMGGKEAVQEILAIDGRARVLVSSGYSDDPIMANPQSFGFVGGITKPYDLDDLARKLSGALRVVAATATA